MADMQAVFLAEYGVPVSEYMVAKPALDVRLALPIVSGFVAVAIILSTKFKKRISSGEYKLLDNEVVPKISALSSWLVAFWSLLQAAGTISVLVLSFVSLNDQAHLLGVWFEIGTLFFISILCLSVFIPKKKLIHDVVNNSISTLLFALWAVELIRNGNPVICIHGRSDDPMNAITILKLSLLSATAILPFLCMPRIPSTLFLTSESTPEEAASIISLLFYSFIDITVYKAWRAKIDLSLPDFIPLRDREDATVLRNKYLKFIDPLSPVANKRLGWGILRIWWKELTFSQICALISTVFGFSNILGLNRLLEYVQDPSAAIIRPWVWVLVFGIGPLVQAVIYNQFIYWSNRMTRQMESVLLQCFFEHSLRVRINEAPTDGSDDKDGKKKRSLVGKINSLMSSDINQLKNARQIIFMVPDAILKAFISAYALWFLLGWSSIVAMVLTIAIIPISQKASTIRAKYQKRYTAATDVRVEKVTEALTGLRATKMFGLEEQVKEELSASRENEQQLNLTSQWIRMAVFSYIRTLPSIVTIATLWTFTRMQHGVLDSATLFTALNLLEAFSNCARSFFMLQSQLIEPQNSLARMQEFISDTPLITDTNTLEIAENPEDWIGFNDAIFYWTLDSPDGEEDSVPFKLKLKELKFPVGKISIITGATGSGKTSLLMALLKEMQWEDGASFNMPRAGGVAYVHQQSWLQNRTVKENILFGNDFDQERYDAVITGCGLATDLDLWAAGDQTEVGEKGVTLSGGQKARITLARAIYSPAKTVLIDDCFSALDIQTSKLILDKCFASPLVKDRTVILVTHHLSLGKLIANWLVVVEGGEVIESGPVDQVLAHAPEVIEALDDDDDDKTKTEEQPSKPLEEKVTLDEAELPSTKLVVDEEKAEGAVSKETIGLLFKSYGGVIFWIFYFVFDFSDYAIGAGKSYWFSLWSRAYSLMPADEVNVGFYLGGYAILTVGLILSMIAGFVLWIMGIYRSGRYLHNELLSSVLKCNLRFLDVTPQGRIIGRFTADMRKIDSSLPNATNGILTIPISLLVNAITLLLVVPDFIPAAFGVAVVAYIISKLYMAPARAAMRENASKQSKLFTNFGDALAGLCSIRAFDAQEAFRSSGLIQINDYIRAQATLHFLSRWNSARFDLLSSAFSTILAVYLIYGRAENDAPAIGFALTVTRGFVESVMQFTMAYSDWQIELNSLERVRDYLLIEHEPEPVKEKTPPAYWPSSGNLVVEKLSAKYTKDGPSVLNDLSFTLKSGERCGVVGRTGSGKSTLALALLRLIPTEGEVQFDSRDTSSLNLTDLRSKITIIPQDPTLYSGDIRKNIDPYNSMDDVQLNDILRSVGLLSSGGSAGASGSSTPATGGKQGVNLATLVSAGGANLSQGTRQLVSLARGLVRSSKLYIVDEATSSVDFETDALIQRTLQTELKDVTLLTIAHRILTIIDYDKILVLSGGKVEEFDTPLNLLTKEGGLFKALVDASSDREELLAIANKSAK